MVSVDITFLGHSVEVVNPKAARNMAHEYTLKSVASPGIFIWAGSSIHIEIIHTVAMCRKFKWKSLGVWQSLAVVLVSAAD